MLASGLAATSARIDRPGPLGSSSHTIVPAKTYTNCTAKTAFQWLAQKADLEPGHVKLKPLR
ncbi:MAG: minor structural protein (endogenous virus) [Lactobacillus phage ViSo-2018b]|nr:MAG: minor structural protein [Lactobacillus phage ViSo-2018b]